MQDQRRIFTPKSTLMMIFFIIIIPFLPLLISWNWSWWEAWVYAILNTFGFIVSRALAARRNPDLLAERGRFLHYHDAKSWDKLLSPLVGLGGALIPLVAGLDALFGWSPSFSLGIKIPSLIILLIGYMIASYALIANRFFSGVVRIQTERGHHLVSDGPYRWVRHPGYAGAILTYLATPLFLDSGWAYLPVLLLTFLLFIRTALEDRTLQNELTGYQNYAEQVRYRLIPGIW